MANLAPYFLSPVFLFCWMSGLIRLSVFCHCCCSMRVMHCLMVWVCISGLASCAREWVLMVMSMSVVLRVMALMARVSIFIRM